MSAAMGAASHDREPGGRSVVGGGGAVLSDGTTQPGGALKGRDGAMRETRVDRLDVDEEHCGQRAESDDNGP